MNHTGGKWSIGKYPGVVITDKRTKYFDGEFERSEWEKQELEFYGGYVIAESIQNKDDAKLMAMAPELLKSLNEISMISKCSNPYLNKDFIILSIIQKALDKLNPTPLLLSEFTDSTINRVANILFNKS